MRYVRAFVCAEFAFAAGAVIYLGFHLCADVFAGSPPALPVTIAASCQAVADAPCHVSVTELYKGRYRIFSAEPARRLTLTLAPSAEVARARALLVRLTRPGAVRLEMHAAGGESAASAPVPLTGSGFRSVTDIAPSPSLAGVSLVAASGSEPAPFVVDEIGFFADHGGLLNDARPLFAWIPSAHFYGFLMPSAIVRLFVFLFAASFVVPGGLLGRVNPLLLGLLGFAFCVLDLAIVFSPYGAHDLRLFYAGGALQELPGSNLNVSVWQGFRLLHGEGLTQSSDVVPWQRMPGLRRRTDASCRGTSRSRRCCCR